MTSTSRSTLTLLVLGLLVAAAALWGWRAMTKPFPQALNTLPCIETAVAAGEAVRSTNVLVNVYNGTARQGVAGSTMSDLSKRGFVTGTTGNTDLLPPGSGVQVLSDTPQDPSVQLVVAQFYGATVVPGDLSPGVDVVIGDAYDGLGPVQRMIKSRLDTTYCKSSGPIDE